MSMQYLSSFYFEEKFWTFGFNKELMLQQICSVLFVDIQYIVYCVECCTDQLPPLNPLSIIINDICTAHYMNLPYVLVVLALTKTQLFLFIFCL